MFVCTFNFVSTKLENIKIRDVSFLLTKVSLDLVAKYVHKNETRVLGHFGIRGA